MADRTDASNNPATPRSSPNLLIDVLESFEVQGRADIDKKNLTCPLTLSRDWAPPAQCSSSTTATVTCRRIRSKS